jgi:membrane-anchored glycerophosphoryl diester phosphodiesterase (GDPDase)
MKMKSMLLIMIIIVMIPEILLTAFIFGRYSINLGFPEVSTTDALSFLRANPLFLVIVIVVFIVMLILYFTLQIK